MLDDKDRNTDKNIKLPKDESVHKDFEENLDSLIDDMDIDSLIINGVLDSPFNDFDNDFTIDDDSVIDTSDYKSTKKKGLHEGHRDRMRNRIKQHGIKSLEEHEILEYILFHFVPRKDVNALAHNMINEFGCLYNVLSAELSKLEKVPNLTKNAALFLSLFVDIYDVAQVLRKKEDIYLTDINEIFDFARPRIANAPFEQLLIILLDINNKVIDEKVFTNKFNKGVTIKRQQIITAATDVHADKVILVHNHPSGNSYPSDEDIKEANNVKAALAYIGITLVDSLIVTRNEVTSINSIIKSYSERIPTRNNDMRTSERIETKDHIQDNDQSEIQEYSQSSTNSLLPEIDMETIDKEWLKTKNIDNID